MPIRILKPSREHKRGRSFRNTRRENRLEELGRVDAERARTSRGKRNLREEKDRIRSELATGGSIGKLKQTERKPQSPSRPKARPKAGPKGGTNPKGTLLTGDHPLVKGMAGGVKGKPHSSKEGRMSSFKRKFDRLTRTAKKGLGKKAGPSPEDIQRIKDKMKKPKQMQPLRKGGSAKKPRPHGPHMWVRGDKRKKYAAGGVSKILGRLGRAIKKQPLPKKTKDLNKKFKKAFPDHDSKGKLKTRRPGYSNGGSAAEHYLQHGYGPHKSAGKVLKGKKIGIQIK